MCYPQARVCTYELGSSTCVYWCVISQHVCVLKYYPLALVSVDVLPLACVYADMLTSGTFVCLCVILQNVCTDLLSPTHVCAYVLCSSTCVYCVSYPSTCVCWYVNISYVISCLVLITTSHNSSVHVTLLCSRNYVCKLMNVMLCTWITVCAWVVDYPHSGYII